MSSCWTCKGLQYHILLFIHLWIHLCYSWIRIRMIVNIQWKRSVFFCSVSRGRTISKGSDKGRVSDKRPSSQSYGFSSSHVWMWELDDKDSWMQNWCFWTVVLEKTLESSLDCKEIQPVNLKGNQSWIVSGRTDTEAETPILQPPDVKNWLLGKNPDAGKDWRKEEKRMTDDEMVGWHHWLDVREFEQALGIGDGQGSLACCSPWSLKESDTTKWLNKL